jgi:chromosome segregation ATPase
MVKDLEEQLDRMITINDKVEKDLGTERKKNTELEAKVQQLTLELQQVEKHAAVQEEVSADIQHLNSERARLVKVTEELREALRQLTEQSAKQARSIERLTLERADAFVELQAVEAQFDRAMAMANDLETRLAVMNEEYEALKGRVNQAEQALRQVETERDGLLAEVEESRGALEDIRRSLVDACVVSQQRWAGEGGEANVPSR